MTERKPVRVTRVQMLAARGQLITNARLGRASPPWLYALATADSDPDWRTGATDLPKEAARKRSRSPASRRWRPRWQRPARSMGVSVAMDLSDVESWAAPRATGRTEGSPARLAGEQALTQAMALAVVRAAADLTLNDLVHRHDSGDAARGDPAPSSPTLLARLLSYLNAAGMQDISLDLTVGGRRVVVDLDSAAGDDRPG